jgi:CheY-like chemotaxis protein
MKMPVMGGLEASAQIRKMERELQIDQLVPIVALTATTFPGDVDEAIKAGLFYLAKPDNKKELAETMYWYESLFVCLFFFGLCHFFCLFLFLRLSSSGFSLLDRAVLMILMGFLLQSSQR